MAGKKWAGKKYVGPVEIVSEPLKFPIAAIQIMVLGSRLWDLDVVGPVEKKVSFHACITIGFFIYTYNRVFPIGGQYI